MIGSSYILDESAELVAECSENFVLILDRFCIVLVWQPRVKAVHERTVQEGNQLVSSPLRTESEGYG